MADWHAERYAATEALAAVARDILVELEGIRMFIPEACLPTLERMHKALAEYERTKDAP